MDYAQAEAALLAALKFGIHPSLEGISALCEELGRPQDACRFIQVTGTNGKTSTVRFTEALLRAEGVRTGLYTSPHLERYPERIELFGQVVADEEFARGIGAVTDAAERLRPGAQGTEQGFTEFELLTAAALWLFREHGVEVAVLEVGLGGRWDATSVVAPSVSVITGVGLDHMAVLGDTLPKIAAEKAAIIRPGSVPVLGPGTAGLEETFLRQAAEAGEAAWAVRATGHASSLGDERAASPAPEDLTVRYTITSRPSAPDDFTVANVAGVLGDYPAIAIAAPAYQAANVATAVAAAEAALGHELTDERVRRAVADITLPGRFELVRSVPPVIVDGSHNPQAAAVLAGAIADAWPDPLRRPVLLLGVLSDKDAEGIVRELAQVCERIAVTTPDSPRALPAPELAAVVAEVTGRMPERFGEVAEALAALAPTAVNGLVVAGSLTTAGEARRELRAGSLQNR